jgi:hypothetical protein
MVRALLGVEEIMGKSSGSEESEYSEESVVAESEESEEDSSVSVSDFFFGVLF